MGIKKLNIAFFVGSELQTGGRFQYEYKVLDILKKYHKDQNIKFNFYGLIEKIQKDYIDLGLDIKIIKENIFQKLHRYSLSNFFFLKIFSKIKMDLSSIEKKLSKDKIDLVYFLGPNIVSHSLKNIPYIFTLWDLGHLDILEFPEISHDGQFETREFTIVKGLRKSYKVIVDSKWGKANVINKYNIDEKRIEVLKFLPNIRINKSETTVMIKEKYKLKNDYIFYPANFWAHKNHMYILRTIKILRDEKNIDIDVIFSGSREGNLEYILDKAKELKIDDLIHYIGFVPNEEIPNLYKQSLSLVMPTYLGPTNIPPLEAFAYETPVCYSDLPYFREQVGDSAFFMDLSDPYSLVKILLTIQNDKQIVDEKKKKGIQVLKNWNEEDFYKKLLDIFNEYKYVRELWK
ncbi:MAG: mannosyltransferase [Candidatus Marinimicrobia bacterium]|nr:mannosyltransferase [Candidatus Neomarinimicrobiota bacterium]|tara:strand:- start:3762 stop:4970 length:1209 start_codon:yes stop_codon:yes gene_type:complete